MLQGAQTATGSQSASKNRDLNTGPGTSSSGGGISSSSSSRVGNTSTSPSQRITKCKQDINRTYKYGGSFSDSEFAKKIKLNVDGNHDILKGLLKYIDSQVEEIEKTQITAQTLRNELHNAKRQNRLKNQISQLQEMKKVIEGQIIEINRERVQAKHLQPDSDYTFSPLVIAGICALITVAAGVYLDNIMIGAMAAACILIIGVICCGSKEQVNNPGSALKMDSDEKIMHTKIFEQELQTSQ
ncbi:hypothetical protein BIY23_03360 [Wolbachia pipientis]|uniref:Uncharacterized protein n=1 Tax=Wolbachia pipientis TaxID=955 RepID=A0A1E7QJC9_WOLPI|nr:hypothetical protein [Wolbachia pipientis]OEY86573.1 hypothetical protein BIY23_03360 [Wolbachia pipientis]